MRASFVTLLVSIFPFIAHAQTDPIVGNWRGTVKSPVGTETPIVITIAKAGDRYVGTTNGLSEGGDIPLRRIEPNGASVTVEAGSESRLGAVSLAATLTADGNAMRGDGTVGVGSQRFPVTFTLQRRARADVVQHQVDQNIAYFVGRWKFTYVGGEYPPLSAGNRQGAITLARAGTSSFVSGTLQADAFGTSIEERMFIGVDPDADAVVLAERRQDGTEMLSVGNWRSPLAITFLTSPVVSGGKTYQLRRVFSILSDSAFDVAEEFSIDGGPFRRLGSGHFTKE
jgi:hypothetical protein